MCCSPAHCSRAAPPILPAENRCVNSNVGQHPKAMESRGDAGLATAPHRAPARPGGQAGSTSSSQTRLPLYETCRELVHCWFTVDKPRCPSLLAGGTEPVTCGGHVGGIHLCYGIHSRARAVKLAEGSELGRLEDNVRHLQRWPRPGHTGRQS